MKSVRGSFKIAVIQMKMSSDPARNLSAAVKRVAQAARAGARIICLPELFRTPYFCQTEDAALFDLAESIPGPCTRALGKVARQHKVAVVVPVFERRAAGVYHNSVAVLGCTGQVVGLYRKMHIPDDPSYYEKFYFTPGDLGFPTFDLGFARIGVLICWDQWYPEAARLAALAGADILFYPTAIGWHPGEKPAQAAAQRDAWMTVQRGHAVANGIYVATANRTGFERPEGGKGLKFWGTSFVVDPQGVVLAEAGVDTEETLYATVDLRHLENIRRNWPFLRDRRIDAYEDMTRRFVDDGGAKRRRRKTCHK